MPEHRKKTRRTPPPSYIDTPQKRKLHQLIAERPQQVSAFKELARVLRECAQYDGAAAILKRGIAHHPGDRDLLLHLARTCCEAGETKRGVALYRKLMRENPDDPIPYERLDRLFRDLGLHEKAVAIYERIGDASPLKERSHERLHHLLVENLRAFARGVKNLRSAIDSFGPNYRRCKDLGRLYAKLGKWREASESYARAMEFKKDDADLLGLLGWSLVESGELGRAEECFKKIGGSFQGAISLAELYLRLGRLEEAEQQLDALRRRYPDSPRIAIGYAELRLKRNDAGGARRLCEETLPRIPSYFAFEQAHAQEVLAAACTRLGDAKASRLHTALAAAVKKGPDTYTALIALAEKRIAGRNVGEADEILKLVLALYPNNSRALLDRCEIHILKGDNDAAVALGEEALQHASPRYKSEQRRGHLLLARAYLQGGDRKNARRHRELGKQEGKSEP